MVEKPGESRYFLRSHVATIRAYEIADSLEPTNLPIPKETSGVEISLEEDEESNLEGVTTAGESTAPEEVNDIEESTSSEHSSEFGDTSAYGDSRQSFGSEDLNPTPVQFKLFAKLPPELREMIWEFALPGPRNLVFKHKFYPQPQFWLTGWMLGRSRHPAGTWRSSIRPDAVPGVLHASRESRTVARRSYTLCLKHNNCGRRLWMDLNKDALYFRNWVAFMAFHGIDTSLRDGEEMNYYLKKISKIRTWETRVKRIGIGGDLEPYLGEELERVVILLNRYASLEQLNIVNRSSADEVEADLRKHALKICYKLNTDEGDQKEEAEGEEIDSSTDTEDEFSELTGKQVSIKEEEEEEEEEDDDDDDKEISFEEELYEIDYSWPKIERVSREEFFSHRGHKNYR